MTDDAILASAKNPDGSQRFYPTYKHPATRQLRDALARAEELDDDNEHVAAYIEHCRAELAKFEAGEDRAKRDYLRAANSQNPSTPASRGAEGGDAR